MMERTEQDLEKGSSSRRAGPQDNGAGWFAVVSRPGVIIGLALAAAAVIALYLFSSSRLLKIGFPLDDAWIHQTYARNLALHGEWAFIPGQVSAGSTAPLWSVLLAGGYVLNLPYLVWAYLLGGLCLFWLSLAGEGLLRAFLPDLRSPWPWAGLFLVGEWHLGWASVSGMETLLYGLAILIVLYRVNHARGRSWFWVGLLVGAGVWVRPDGLTLLGPAGLTLLLVETGYANRARGLGWLAAGLLVLFAPYLLFNLAIQGTFWPNTLYAKQAEYAALRDLPLVVRWLNEIKLPVIGAGLFLLPGFLFFLWESVRKQHWAAVSAAIWFLGYALVYALLLPVTYQYGRYFMPAMPVFFVSGIAGTVSLVSRLGAGRVKWMLTRVWIFSTAAVWLAFLIIGAGRYANDVAIIETEMVASARWIADNTPPGALVAAHDIGALGYFGDRRLLDLAGLITPEVTPFIRDETGLSAWLDTQGAEYLVVFSDWYQELPVGKEALFMTDGRFSSAQGGGNTVIYSWK